MTTVQINLPDELAQKAASAGLLSAEAMEAMLREQLRRRAGESLQAMWQRGPKEELTPEVERQIVEDTALVTLVVPASVPRVVAGDADDDHVIAAAVAARAELIVTGDRKHLLPIGSHQGIAIVTAREVVDRIKATGKT